MEYEAERLRDNRWCVRPVGQLGTCGFSPVAWSAIFVTARDAAEALTKAARKRVAK